ncbi:Zinc finger protein 557 [Eumeta japonica]|uniref:Zinc finger protein 557 n=1 Tax=Eumeta variegata TaxID=151549 RepID=A0A4C1UEP4_EUMVA|nr:Zinc finger protein 557 [Eumeta japonica]
MTHRSRHVCSVCGASFVSESGLNQHTKYVHKAEIRQKIEVDTANVESETYCHKCDITFENQQAYEEHTRNSTLHVDDQDCDLNNSGTKPKLLKPGKEVHKPTPATCDQCGDRFATERACARHKKRVHESPARSSGRYICEICGASISPCSIFQHQNTHTRAHVYPCATCGKVFKTPANRSRHLVTHTGEKPFACRLCDKRFTQRNSVKLHVRTYHQKQPYPARDRRRKKLDSKHDTVQ